MTLLAALTLGVLVLSSAASASRAGEATARGKLLFCTSGPLGGYQPFPPPSDFESEFAIAVVEINAPGETGDAAVTQFSLFDRAGRETKLKRVVSVEDFNELHVPGNGNFAYYMHPPHSGGTQPWNGTLLAGMNQLRIRVSLPRGPYEVPQRCAVRFGRYLIEGPYDGSVST
ncbi:MAG TPA: hypothetical protein VGC96_14790 [Candidatus Elarobacter sp.]